MKNIEKKAQEVIDVWNSKDLNALQRLYGDTTGFYDPLLGKEIKGEAILAYAKGIFEAFPDLEFIVKGIAASENLAMVEWSQNGTNSGLIMGKPATGRYVEIPAVSVVRFDGNQFISQRDYWDMKSLLEDLFA